MRLLLVVAFFLSARLCLSQPAVPTQIQHLLDSLDYDGAAAAIQKHLASTPDWDAGHILLAQISSGRKDYRRAKLEAESALRIRESLDALMLAAVASMYLGDLNQSIELLEKAARRAPDHARIYKILGMDYTLGGMHEEAAKAFERAVRLSPADWEAHYLNGRALYELKNLPAARAALERAAQLDPASVRARAALGQVEERLQDLPAAERSYRGAVELCGNRGAECAWPLLELGLLTKRLSGDDKAEPYLRKAIAARPDWAKPHFFLGKLLATRDDLEAARTELETAVKLDAAKSEYYYQLALVCRRMGLERDAERYLARFREIAKLGESADHDIELTQP